jgi:hypothetical protein
MRSNITIVMEHDDNFDISSLKFLRLRYNNRDWKYRDKSKYRNIAQPYTEWYPFVKFWPGVGIYF